MILQFLKLRVHIYLNARRREGNLKLLVAQFRNELSKLKAKGFEVEVGRELLHRATRRELENQQFLEELRIAMNMETK